MSMWPDDAIRQPGTGICLVYRQGRRSRPAGVGSTLGPSPLYQRLGRSMPGEGDKRKAEAMELQEGDAAPDFRLPRDGGGEATLADFHGRKLVLYAYPKDDTTGCTQEAIDFNRLRGEFAACGTDIVGVSPDPAKRHDRFKQKHGLDLTLLADESQVLANAYGIWVEKSLYGRKYMGIERATFLIDPQGRIARVWRKVKVAGHAEAVLAAARAL